MKTPFFARRSRIPGISNGLLILMIVCFIVPFALRGSKMVTQQLENDIKDWLPSEFEETEQLEWFGEHFLGEQFIVITWEGCTEEDESFQLFVEKLQREVLPRAGSQLDEPLTPASLPEGLAERELFLRRRQQEEELEAARQLGDELELYTAERFRELDNWAGLNEKWLKDLDGSWYYVLPDGTLYRWSGRENIVNGLLRWFQHDLFGNYQLSGTRLAQFGSLPDPEFDYNEFHDNPQLLCARFFTSIRTGPDVLEELSGEGGPLRPRGNVNQSLEQRIAQARRDGLDRLTGTMFAPALPREFGWTADEVKGRFDESRQQQLPADWQQQLQLFVDQLIEEQYEGQRELLLAATSIPRARHWEAFCKQIDIQPPPRQTCIVATLSDTAKKDLQRLVGRGLLDNPAGRLIEIATECALAPPVMPGLTPWSKSPPPDGRELRLAGPPVDNGAIDEEGQITLFRLLGLSLVLGITLSFLAFRSVKITFMVFFVGGTSALVSLALVWYSGQTADSILLSMPSLVYVLGLSGAVHIVNYYRDAVDEVGVEGAPERALSHGWWPCTLAAFTTSLGLMSLYNSGLLPIKKFGLYSAIGVMATVFLLFSYLPSALTLWPPKFKDKKKQEKKGQQSASDLPLKGDSRIEPLTRFWLWIGDGVIKRWRTVLALSAIVLLVAGSGVFKINTSVQLLKLFDGNAKIVKDYEWLEENFGKLVPMEVVLNVDSDFQLPFRAAMPDLDNMPAVERNRMKYQYSFLERIELVGRVQTAVEAVFGEGAQDVIGRGISATSFAPQLPSAQQRTQRISTNALLERNRDRLMAEDYLAIDNDDLETEIWRISLRLGALNDVDYGLFVDQLRDVVRPISAAYSLRNTLLEKFEQDLGESGVYNAPNVFFDDNRVLVLGAHPQGSFVKEDSEQPDRIQRFQVDHHKLMVQTFNDLMQEKGFSNRFGSPSELYWVDPAEEPFQSRLKEWDDEQWAGFLGKYRYVILLRDHPLLDRTLLGRHCQQLIDAVPASEHELIHASLVGDPGFSPVFTGAVPIVYKAQETLLESLQQSIGMAFGMICVVMVFLLRNGTRTFSRITFWVPMVVFAVVAIPLHQLLDLPILVAMLAGCLAVSMVVYGNILGGLVSMVPNVFPVVLVFGLMGHSGIMVDIGSMMTASVAMGVAVDDTIHFLNWFRMGLNDGMDRQQAVRQSYKRCSAAMTQTTLIGGLGLSVFAISTFAPTQRFGILMLTLLSAALVGDLIFLPALLVSPIGRLFVPRVAAKQAAGDLEEGPGEEVEQGDESLQPHLDAASQARRRHDAAHRPRPG